MANVIAINGDEPLLDLQREFAAFAAEQVELFKNDSGEMPCAMVVLTMDSAGNIRSSHYAPSYNSGARYWYALSASCCHVRALE